MEEIVSRVVQEVLSYLKRVPVTVTISNRHIHLSKKDREILFGDKPLTVKKYLGQPGQFAAEEVVKILGPKGQFDSVRVVGPERSKTQVELSISDCYHLGIDPVVRDSGKHEGTPGVLVIGPKGFVKLEDGVIVAQRHIHMTPEDAQKYGVKDMQLVRIRFDSGVRRGVLGDVLIRVHEQFALECHLDIEEANALGIKNNDIVYMELGGI